MVDLPNSKLPRLPKVHGSLPKLPAFGKKANSAAEIPALSSQATLLPDAPLADLEGGSQTEAVPQPTAEAIARGIAALNAKRRETPGMSLASDASPGLSTPAQNAAEREGQDPAAANDPMAWAPNASATACMPLETRRCLPCWQSAKSRWKPAFIVTAAWRPGR